MKTRSALLSYSRIAILGIFLLTASAFAPEASADSVRYSYVSPNFTDVTGLFTTSDNVVGTITLDYTLGIGGTGLQGQLGFFSFLNTRFRQGDFGLSHSTILTNSFDVDASGAIVSWDFDMLQSEIGGASGEIHLKSNSIPGTSIIYASESSQAHGPSGTWTLVSVPEPCSVMLSSLGIGIVGMFFWRKRKLPR